MAGCTAEDHGDIASLYRRQGSEFGGVQFRNATAKRGTTREVVLMDSAMDRVDVDRRGHIEARLLEAQAQASGASEQIDSD